MIEQIKKILFGRKRTGVSKKPSQRQVRGIYEAAWTNDENEQHWSYADNLSPNAALDPFVRETIRNRARYEAANNGYAAGTLQNIADDLVGNGPRLQLRVPDVSTSVANRIEDVFRSWSEQIDLVEKLRLLHLTKVRDGEAFAVMVSNPALSSRDSVSLDLILYEADQVRDPFDYGFDPLYADGIRRDEFGNIVEYTFLRYHPGGPKGYMVYETMTLSADQVIHWYTPLRPGQSRGVSALAPVLNLFAQLRRYTLATLSAAETAAMFAGVLKTPFPVDPEVTQLDPRGMDSFQLKRNSLITLPYGTEAQQFKPEQPTTTYPEYVKTLLNEIARGLNVPFNVISGNSSGYNYSSGRLDHLIYHRSIRTERTRLAQRVLRPIFSSFVEEAALLGLIPESLPPLERWSVNWHYEPFDSIDPVKDAQALALQLQNKTVTLADVYAERGRDWEQELIQIARERKLMRDLGVDELSQQEAAVSPGNGGPPDEEEDAAE
ncbi:MAG: hypothetical protein KatS3mg105_5015 [Gemmatales bacterium]|nr:MAG: hypothetical protein KatS3mg105_5015 [Gemmatales bacterium]